MPTVITSIKDTNNEDLRIHLNEIETEAYDIHQFLNASIGQYTLVNEPRDIMSATHEPYKTSDKYIRFRTNIDYSSSQFMMFPRHVPALNDKIPPVRYLINESGSYELWCDIAMDFDLPETPYADACHNFSFVCVICAELADPAGGSQVSPHLRMDLAYNYCKGIFDKTASREDYRKCAWILYDALIRYRLLMDRSLGMERHLRYKDKLDEWLYQVIDVAIKKPDETLTRMRYDDNSTIAGVKRIQYLNARINNAQKCFKKNWDQFITSYIQCIKLLKECKKKARPGLPLPPNEQYFRALLDAS